MFTFGYKNKVNGPLRALVAIAIGAMMVMTGKWKKPGVYNIEEFDPDPFMEALNKYGLPILGNLTMHIPVKPKYDFWDAFTKGLEIAEGMTK